jgi:aconitate hydratase
MMERLRCPLVAAHWYGSDLVVVAAGPSGSPIPFTARVRIDTPVELEYYRNGSILQTVLRKLLKGATSGGSP